MWVFFLSQFGNCFPLLKSTLWATSSKKQNFIVQFMNFSTCINATTIKIEIFSSSPKIFLCFLSLQVSFVFFRGSYKCNQTVCDFCVCLASFAQQKGLEIYTWCFMHHFTPCKCWIVLYCMNIAELFLTILMLMNIWVVSSFGYHEKVTKNVCVEVFIRLCFHFFGVNI